MAMTKRKWKMLLLSGLAYLCFFTLYTLYHFSTGGTFYTAWWSGLGLILLLELYANLKFKYLVWDKK